MPNQRKLKNVKDIAIIILLIVVGWQSCRKPSDTHTREVLRSSDTVDRVEQPVIHEHWHTNIVPERVVEHHYHNEPIDTNAVVQDYFRARYYRDSLINDTVSYWWAAKVSRNTLDTFYLRTSFKPRTRIITNRYEHIRPSIGLMALYASGNPFIGAFGTWQTKRFSMSGGISPMNGGAFLFGIGIKIGK